MHKTRVAFQTEPKGILSAKQLLKLQIAEEKFKKRLLERIKHKDKR